jgi:WD40 repeat protein
MRHIPIATAAVVLLAAAASAQVPKEFAVLRGHREAAWHLAFSPDGRLLASSGEPCVRVWDVEARREVVTLEAPEGVRWGRSVAFAPEARTLAYLFDDGVVRLWDAKAAGGPAVVGAVDDGWGGVAFLPDGRLLAYSREHATLFDPKTHAPLAVFTGPADSFNSAALTPDGKTLISAGHDAKVRLWDVGDQHLRAVLTRYERIVWAVAVAPGGRLAASGSEDGVLNFWDVGTGELLATVKGHRGRITSLTFTPDGGSLASTGNDNRLRFWDAHTRRERFTLSVPGETVRGVVFTRDGRTMATGNVDGAIRL